MAYNAADRAYKETGTGVILGRGGIDYNAVLTLAVVGRVAKRNNQPPAVAGIINTAVPAWFTNEGIPPVISNADVKTLSSATQVSAGTVRRWFGLNALPGAVPLTGDTLPLIVCGLDGRNGREPVPARRFSNIRYADNVPGTATDSTGVEPNSKEYRRYLRGLLAVCLCNSGETLRGNFGAVGYGGLYRTEPENCKKLRDGTPAIYENTPFESGTIIEALRYAARCTYTEGYEINDANQKMAENWVRIWIEATHETYPRYRTRVRFTVNPQGSDAEPKNIPIPATDTEAIQNAEA